MGKRKQKREERQKMFEEYRRGPARVPVNDEKYLRTLDSDVLRKHFKKKDETKQNKEDFVKSIEEPVEDLEWLLGKD